MGLLVLPYIITLFLDLEEMEELVGMGLDSLMTFLEQRCSVFQCPQF